MQDVNMTKTREAAEWYHVGLRSALKHLVHKQDEVSSKELLGSLHRNQSHVTHSNSRREWRNKERGQEQGSEIYHYPLTMEAESKGRE